MTTAAWIKKLPSSLLLQESIPIGATVQKFSLEEAAKQLSVHLQLQVPVSLSDSLPEWKEPELLFSDLANPQISSFAIPSFPSTAQLAMSKSDLCKTVAALLGDNEETIDKLDEEVLAGFFQFISLRVAQTLLDLGLGYPLQLCDEPSIPGEPAICIDIKATFSKGAPVLARIAIPQSFYTIWCEKNRPDPIKQITSSPLSELVDLPLHIEVGRLRLSQEEWDTVRPGDLILFPRCGVDKETLQGHVYLTLYNEPVFEGNFDGHKISIAGEPTHIEDQYMRKP